MSNTQDMNPKTTQKRGAVLAFFSNPVVGIAGSLASIISVLLAIYFFIAGSRYRELVYYVHPAKAVVVKTGESSRLRVSIADEELKSDVTAAQVAIWNQGRDSIRADNVLEAITIQLTPAVRILEARVRKQSRTVVDLRLDELQGQSGLLAVSWKILEQGDGGVIQLVYAGGPNVEIGVSGVIEGQPNIRRLDYFSGNVRSELEHVKPEQRSSYLLLKNLFFLALGVVWLVFGLPHAARLWRGGGTLLPSSLQGIFAEFVVPLAMDLVFPLVMIAIGVYFIVTTRYPEPPFGF